MSAAETYIGVKPAPIIAGFSSRGPSSVQQQQQPLSPSQELLLTDGHSVNFNGHFLSNSSAIQLPKHSPPLQLVYVTERNGYPTIFYDAIYSSSMVSNRIQIPLLTPSLHFPIIFSLLSLSLYLFSSLTKHTLSHSTKKAELVVGVVAASHSHFTTLRAGERSHIMCIFLPILDV